MDVSFEEGPSKEPGSPDTTLSIQATWISARASRVWEKYYGDPLKITESIYQDEPTLFDETFVGEGQAVNSGEFTGQHTAEFKKNIGTWLEERGLGTRKINYKLRDWLFSRQRYWGEPAEQPITKLVVDLARAQAA